MPPNTERYARSGYRRPLRPTISTSGAYAAATSRISRSRDRPHPARIEQQERLFLMYADPARGPDERHPGDEQQRADQPGRPGNCHQRHADHNPGQAGETGRAFRAARPVPDDNGLIVCWRWLGHAHTLRDMSRARFECAEYERCRYGYPIGQPGNAFAQRLSVDVM